MLLDENNSIKLADMSEAKEIMRSVTTHTFKGTIPYISPEQFTTNGKYSFKSDIW